MLNTYKTACGGKIVITGRALDHLAAHPDVAEILPDAIGLIRLPRNGGFLETTAEFGRIVGKAGLIRTPKIGIDDVTTFALRANRAFPSRVAIGEGDEVDSVAIVAKLSREDRRCYLLVTAFFGRPAPGEPWDSNLRDDAARARSLEFWTQHAIAYDPAAAGPIFESTWGEVLRNAARP